MVVAAGSSSSSVEHECSINTAVGRNNNEENLLIPNGEASSWYPRLLNRPRSSCGHNSSGAAAARKKVDSFPAGLEISAMSVASLYDVDDETRTMSR